MTPEFKAAIERLLSQNETLPRKQRWIGRTIFLALQQLGYQGSEPSIRRYMAQTRKDKRKRSAFIPLAYHPGEVGEFDWGEAEVVLDGQVLRVQIL